MTNSLVQSVTRLAEPLAASLGLEIWGVEIAFGGRGLVRVFVEDKCAAGTAAEKTGPAPGSGPSPNAAPGSGVSPDAAPGVTIDQCAELSRLLGLSLDVEDSMPGAYVLEISSPGLERVFFTPAQLSTALGRELEINLDKPKEQFPGRRKFRGILAAAPDGQNGEEGRFTLRAKDVARPGEEEPLIAFRFEELKKVRQVLSLPEKGLPPGKASDKSGGPGGKGKRAKGPSGAPEADFAPPDAEMPLTGDDNEQHSKK